MCVFTRQHAPATPGGTGKLVKLQSASACTWLVGRLEGLVATAGPANTIGKPCLGSNTALH